MNTIGKMIPAMMLRALSLFLILIVPLNGSAAEPPGQSAAPLPGSSTPSAEKSVKADICIYGGTSAGVIAAVQASRMGKSVVLVEPGQHLGGMSVEGLGSTDIDNHAGFQNSPAVGGLALEFYRRISKHYGRQDAFDEMVKAGSKKRNLWNFEPHVAEAVFNDWVKEANLQVLLGHRLSESNGVVKEGQRIRSIRCENNAIISASVFIDATYEGDLLASAGISFAVGREGNQKYGETKNGIRADTTHGQFDKRVDPYRVPGDPASGTLIGVQNVPFGQPGDPDGSIQGYSFRLCLTKNQDNLIPLGMPDNYDPQTYELQRRYLQAGGHINAPGAGIPSGKTDVGTWHFLASNLTGWNHQYPTASYAERERMIKESRDYIQGVYWFMSHDSVVPEQQRAEWRQWGLCKDEFIDNGGWPRVFYVRNGRRMISDFVLTEDFLRKEPPLPIIDSVGMIWWPPDLHHARRLAREGRVWNEGAVFDASKDATWRPCGIPYRVLVPRTEECTNLLTPTCPSSSYVAYGAYRIEFTFMVAAQSAATAAAMAIDGQTTVQQVNYTALRDRLLQDHQVLGAKGGK